MSQSHPFANILVRLAADHLVTPEEQNILNDILAKITGESSEKKLKEALGQQASFQLATGFFANRLMAHFKDAEEQVERFWCTHYRLLRGSSETRVTEAQVNAHVRGIQEYLVLKDHCMRLKYYADQLAELRGACVAWGRMLEQLSNNFRVEVRQDLEGDD